MLIMLFCVIVDCLVMWKSKCKIGFYIFEWLVWYVDGDLGDGIVGECEWCFVVVGYSWIVVVVNVDSGVG